MNKQIFIAVLVFVGLVAMYSFYNLGKSEDVPKKIAMQSNNASTINMPEKNTIERTIDRKTMLKKISTHKQSTFISVKKDLVSKDILYDNPVSMEAHTQEVYTTLLPDNYDKSIEKADESFKALDRHVNKISQRLDEHIKISATGKSFREKELLPMDETYEMELPVIHE